MRQDRVESTYGHLRCRSTTRTDDACASARRGARVVVVHGMCGRRMSFGRLRAPVTVLMQLSCAHHRAHIFLCIRVVLWSVLSLCVRL